eukprot:7112145-Alexandrium_andersonii.AAC.1
MARTPRPLGSMSSIPPWRSPRPRVFWRTSPTGGSSAAMMSSPPTFSGAPLCPCGTTCAAWRRRPLSLSLIHI